MVESQKKHGKGHEEKDLQSSHPEESGKPGRSKEKAAKEKSRSGRATR